MKIDSQEQVYLEMEDLVKISGIIAKKMLPEPINLDSCLLVPITIAGAFLARILEVSSEIKVRNDTILTFGRGSIKDVDFGDILLVDLAHGMKDDEPGKARAMIRHLAKKLKITKKLAKCKWHLVAGFSNADKKEIPGNINLVAGFYSQRVDNLHVIPPPGDSQCRSMSLEDAARTLGWDADHVFPQEHEVILDKLKTELWD